MELKQLEFFLVSAEIGSFKKAAKALFTTQPNVSKIVRSLELELGKDLFVRHSQGVTLTETGECVYENAKKIFPYVNAILKLAEPKTEEQKEEEK